LLLPLSIKNNTNDNKINMEIFFFTSTFVEDANFIII
jgi:hypothetical protein